MIRDAEVDAQLQRILDSSVFISSERSRQFLSFCVDRVRRGEAAQLKETTIAVEVFLRSADYDPKSDPIVRVHARRVREKLERYYRTAGTDDPIKIDLPKGGYVPQILRTLPKRKIDFTDWEQKSAFDDPEDAPQAAVASPSTAKRISSSFVAALICGIALLSFTLGWIWRGKPSTGAVSIGTLRPMDSLPGNVFDAAWSPDGKRLAFAAALRGEDTTHIYIRDTRSGDNAVRLTEDAVQEARPTWSPDGRQIAFVRTIDPFHFEVVRFDLASKAMRSVGRSVTYWSIPEDHPALDWSPDGRTLLTVEQTAPSNPMRIILISLATGGRTYLTSPPVGSSGDIDAKFSPDGQWVAFRRGGLGDLYVVSKRGEQVEPATRLTFDTKGVRGMSWIDHGQSILFGTQRGQSAAFGLWRISMRGGTPEPVTPPDFDAVNPSVSSTGSMVTEHRLMVSELVEHSWKGASAERVLLSSDKIDCSPVYSPDGSSVAFISTRTGWGELWIYRLGQAAPIQLTHFQGAGLIFFPSWAPDGKSIVFSFRQNGATNLMIDDIALRSLRQITSTHNRDISPVYSSDGRFLFFSSNDDGTSRIWRMRADSEGRPEPLFLEAVVGFLPSADGQWLYFIHEGPQLTLSRRSLFDGTTEDIFHVAGRPTFANSIAIANRHIYVAVSQEDRSCSQIYEIDPDRKDARVVDRLKDLPPFSEAGISGFSVAPDGSKLIVGRTKNNESTLYTAAILR